MLLDSISQNKNSTAASVTTTPGPGPCWWQGKRMLWLALPLTLAVGCASDPGRSGWTDQSFNKFPTPITTPVTGREVANVAVGREMFDLFLTMTNANGDLSAVSENGVVTLGGSSFAGDERQSLVNQVSELSGVNRVRNEQGTDLTATAVTNAVVVR